MENHIDKIIGEVFGKSTDITAAIWEKSKKTEGYNRVYTLHQVSGKKESILWYKIVVPFDSFKKETYGKTFYRMWDLDCSYRTVIYDDIKDFKNKLLELRDNPKFGKLLTELSKFSDTPMELINNSLRLNGQTHISILGVEFKPKWKSIPCDMFNCDFNMTFSNQLNITLNVAKTENELWTLRFHNTSIDDKITIDSMDNIPNEIALWVIDNKLD